MTLGQVYSIALISHDSKGPYLAAEVNGIIYVSFSVSRIKCSGKVQADMVGYPVSIVLKWATTAVLHEMKKTEI